MRELLFHIIAFKNLPLGVVGGAAIWIILLPLANFVLLGLGKKYLKNIARIFSTVLLFVATIIALNIAYHYFFIDGKVNGVYQTINVYQMHWLSFTETMHVEIGIQLDALSVMMLVVVTFISLMVHLFSLGYMKGEERYCNYFSYLGLFTFSMLGLVVATNLLQLYMCWELVGISSYLLIGFYFQKPSAVAAAKKAFIVTRFADLGLLIGILILSFNTNSFNFQTIIQTLTNTQSSSFISITASSFLGMSTLTWALVLIFIGGAGKSAMLPLHIWLPDAMEGPTPVSALIHAATMVTAGIYMIARSNILYSLSEATQHLVAIVGLATALFAATIAIKQNDIKKVLAYSTVSQLGYMFLGLGVGAYTGAVFHVMTHAFFKALLFLGAGSVIHAMHHEQDMRKMGGLKKYLPITHITFLVGCIAISGIPPFSGFFSKDEILAAAYAKNPIYWGIGVATAALTAFYMFRLYATTFLGNFRGTHEQAHHLHESPSAMTIPLIVLAVLSVVGGFFNVPEVLGGHSSLHQFLSPAITSEVVHEASHSTEYMLMGISVAIAVIAIVVAINKFSKKPELQEAHGFAKLLENKWYVDELYDNIIVKPLNSLGSFFKNIIERRGIDGMVNGVGKLVNYSARQLRLLQNGLVGGYILFMVLAIIVLIYVWINDNHILSFFYKYF